MSKRRDGCTAFLVMMIALSVFACVTYELLPTCDPDYDDFREFVEFDIFDVLSDADGATETPDVADGVDCDEDGGAGEDAEPDEEDDDDGDSTDLAHADAAAGGCLVAGGLGVYLAMKTTLTKSSHKTWVRRLLGGGLLLLVIAALWTMHSANNGHEAFLEGGKQYIPMLLAGCGFLLTIGAFFVVVACKHEQNAAECHDDHDQDAGHAPIQQTDCAVPNQRTQQSRRNRRGSSTNWLRLYNMTGRRRRLIQEKFEPAALPTTLGAVFIVCCLVYLFFAGQSVPQKTANKHYITKKAPAF